MKDDVPDKIRVLTCLIAVVLAFSVNVSSAKAPEPFETERFSTIQGNSLISTSPIITLNEYYDLISRYDWNVDTALLIMFYESGGNSDAHNFSHKTKDDSWGLFQINRYGNLAKERPLPEWLVVPENNIAFAYQLWLEDGWKPWLKSYNKMLQ